MLTFKQFAFKLNESSFLKIFMELITIITIMKYGTVLLTIN